MRGNPLAAVEDFDRARGEARRPSGLPVAARLGRRAAHAKCNPGRRSRSSQADGDLAFGHAGGRQPQRVADFAHG